MKLLLLAVSRLYTACIAIRNEVTSSGQVVESDLDLEMNSSAQLIKPQELHTFDEDLLRRAAFVNLTNAFLAHRVNVAVEIGRGIDLTDNPEVEAYVTVSLEAGSKVWLSKSTESKKSTLEPDIGTPYSRYFAVFNEMVELGEVSGPPFASELKLAVYVYMKGSPDRLLGKFDKSLESLPIGAFSRPTLCHLEGGESKNGKLFVSVTLKPDEDKKEEEKERPQVKIEILRGSSITEPNDVSFVIVSLGDGQSHKTDSVLQNPSPEWEEIVTFDMQPEVEFLDVNVLKELPFNDPALLGEARVPLEGLKFGEPIEEWYEISGGVAKQSPKILLRLTLMHKGTKLETVKEMDGGVIQFFTGGLEKESDREQAAKILKLDWTKDGFLEPGSRNTIQNGGYRGGAIARDVNSNIVAVQVLSEVTKELSGEGFDISVKEAKRLEVHAEWGENAWKWKAWMWQGLVAAGKDLGHAALFTKICLSDFSSFKKYAVDIMAIDDPSYQPYNYPTGVLQPYVVGYVDPEVQYPLQDVYVFLMHPLQDPEGVSFEDYKAALLANLIKSDANMAEQWRERYMRPGQWRKNGEFTRRMLAEVFRRNQILSDPSLSAENLKTLSAWLGLPE
mmetsp:Transcript_22973/g.41886  ORF Transcript_22973/g.41886 Transcript_22973/m.41886 type:complete len:617 (-) Transcript_22973:36-1886(-)